MGDAVKIDGLSQFVRDIKRLDSNVPKALRLAFNDAAQLVVDHARSGMPRRTGAAAKSLKVRSTQKAVRIAAGGKGAEYYPWLDFGGRTGRNKSVKRPFISDGRYLYPALAATRPQFEAAVAKALTDAAQSAGLEVT
jgi:hypothetical protein